MKVRMTTTNAAVVRTVTATLGVIRQRRLVPGGERAGMNTVVGDDIARTRLSTTRLHGQGSVDVEEGERRSATADPPSAPLSMPWIVHRTPRLPCCGRHASRDHLEPARLTIDTTMLDAKKKKI
jgi:hypothetical protein